jgi:3-dehydroquinate synthase
MAVHFLNSIEEFGNIGLDAFKKILLITDTEVFDKCYDLIHENLPPHEVLCIPNGDENKNINQLENIWDACLNLEMSRQDLIIGLGGGMITDLAGFAAATYKRSCMFVSIPTSMTGMIDAAHGGKNGINHGAFKNVIGSFNEPSNIFIYPRFLKTLPEKELKSGFSEVIKHGIINGGNLWTWIKTIEPHELANFNIEEIKSIISVKEKIVAADYNESGLRKTLNLGHSIGHALEALYMENGMAKSHGYCVALGMVIESLIAHAHYYLSDEDLNEILAVIQCHIQIELIPYGIADILAKLIQDKKNTNKLLFSLPLEIGHVQFDCEVKASQIEEALVIYDQFCR